MCRFNRKDLKKPKLSESTMISPRKEKFNLLSNKTNPMWIARLSLQKKISKNRTHPLKFSKKTLNQHQLNLISIDNKDKFPTTNKTKAWF